MHSYFKITRPAGQAPSGIPNDVWMRLPQAYLEMRSGGSEGRLRRRDYIRNAFPSLSEMQQNALFDRLEGFLVLAGAGLATSTDNLAAPAGYCAANPAGRQQMAAEMVRRYVGTGQPTAERIMFDLLNAICPGIPVSPEAVLMTQESVYSTPAAPRAPVSVPEDVPNRLPPPVADTTGATRDSSSPWIRWGLVLGAAYVIWRMAKPKD